MPILRPMGTNSPLHTMNRLREIWALTRAERNLKLIVCVNERGAVARARLGRFDWQNEWGRVAFRCLGQCYQTSRVKCDNTCGHDTPILCSSQYCVFFSINFGA